jgi:hypothetical protein
MSEHMSHEEYVAGVRARAAETARSMTRSQSRFVGRDGSGAQNFLSKEVRNQARAG